MSEARFLVGDVFERMAELPDGSVDLVLTSPPFLALRSYLPADHPDKGKEIGSEPTPAAFLDTLLALSAEWRRLLAPHGSLCVELGDTYSRSGQGPDDLSYQAAAGWPLAKSICGIPHLYHLSLAYGRNLLTGEPSPAGQWRIRNVVAWVRPNPPVGALGDKFRPATSYMTVACVSDRRYFDLDAVRTQTGNDRDDRGSDTARLKDKRDGGGSHHGVMRQVVGQNPAGAPPLDWWEIPTHPYPGSHYATWPPAICERPIKAMCPQRVCRVCGKPSERITSDPEYVAARQAFRDGQEWGDDRVGMSGSKAPAWKVQETLGWSDCGHDDWRNGHVLDPFGGSGTTAAVATGHGRDCTLIDLDPRNADLARDRVGMFLAVDP